jgi:sugar-specific transcriptional regulator TrmB
VSNPEIIKRQIEALKLQFADQQDAESEEWLSSIESETDLIEFIEKMVLRIQDTKILVGGLKEYMSELKDRQDRLESRMDGLRQTVAGLMDRADISKIEMPMATVSIRTGQPQLIGDAEPEDLPQDLIRTKIELNRTAIKDALKAGREVTGFCLSNSPPQLTIRIR